MIYLASDHAGFKLKGELKKFLDELKLKYEDLGPYSFDPDDDYPDFIIPTAKKVAKNPNNRGIILGGSGQGEAIAANRINGVRATVYYGKSLEIIRLSKEHNNANILSLGARFLTTNEAKKAVRLWLETPFSNAPRHKRRIKKLG